MTNFAQLGIEINSQDAREAATNLDAMAASGAKAQASADKLAKATTDWSKEQQKANERVKEMEAAETRRANSAKRSADVVKQQQQELSKLIGTIDPTVSALDRLDKQQQQLAKFRKSGILDTSGFNEYNSKIEQQRKLLGGLSTSSEKAGMSAKAMAAATRGLPAQFTDIAVSLQAGQAPLTVFLQQGGQLKDMFGGIGPAAKAMGGYIAGLVTPLTVAGAALAAIAVAGAQAAKEQESFTKALITTGNYAGVVNTSIASLADSMAQINGVTAGNATKALTAVAATGKFTGDQFLMVAEAAAMMERSTGQSIDTTIEKFKRIGKDPVNALLELNDTEHFLTQTQLERVEALIKEGRETDAIAEATRIYKGQIDDVSAAALAARPHLTQLWDGLKDSTSAAWAEVKGFTEFLASAVSQQQARPWWQRIGPASGISMISDLYSANPAAPVNVAQRADAVDSATVKKNREDAAKFAADAARYLTDAERKTADLKALEDLRTRGIITQAQEIERRGRIEEAYAKKSTRATRTATNADENSARTLIETAQRQIVANEQLATSGEKVTASGRLIIQINQRLADSTDKMTGSSRRELEATRDKLALSDQEAAAAQQKQRDLKASIALTEQLAGAADQSARARELELGSVGMGSADVQIFAAQLKQRQVYLDQVRDLDKWQQDEATRVGQAEYDRQKGQLQAHLDSELTLMQQHNARMLIEQGNWVNGATKAFADYAYEAGNIAALTENLFTNAFSGTEDALVNFVTTGKFSFQDFANSIIKDLARIAARQAVTGIFGNLFVGSIGGVQRETIGLIGGGGAGGSWASGGYTGVGGKYQPAGIVHKGEVVWSQRDVAAVGGPQVANAMRPTAGYANGGIVGGSSRGPSSGNVRVEVINNGQPASATATTSTGPNGESIIRVVLDAVADNITSGGVIGRSIQNNYGLARAV